jgi:hypothetical protein
MLINSSSQQMLAGAMENNLFCMENPIVLPPCPNQLRTHAMPVLQVRDSFASNI